MAYTIYKRNNGTWYVSFSHRGRRYQKSTRCTNKRDADRAARDIVAGVTQPRATETALDHWVETYLSSLLISGRTLGYRKEVRRRLDYMLDGLGETEDLSLFHLQPRVDALAQSGRSTQTQAHYIQSLKTFMTWLYDREVITSDPGRRIKKPRIREADKASPRGCLAVHEFNSLLESTAVSAHVRFRMNGTRRALLYRLAAGTGLRLGECSCLHTDSMRLRSHSLFLYLPGTATKNGTHLLQPVSGTLAAELKALPHGPIFPRLNKGSAFMKADLEDASIPYVDSDGKRRDFHSLRAYYITRLLENGVPIHVVQRLARHASPTTTMSHYAKVSSDTNFMTLLDDADL